MDDRTCHVMHVAAALHQVNQLRAERGIGEPLECLPKGKTGSVQRCPVARALGPGVLVDGETAFFVRTDDHVWLSPGTQKFIEEFDDGDYPEYAE